MSRVARLNSQKGFNALASAMRDQLRRPIRDEDLKPFKRYNPMQLLMEWYNGYQMDLCICAESDKRYQERRSSNLDVPKTKSVIDLALADYMRDRKAGHMLDGRFK